MDRIEPDRLGDERTQLTQFLDHHRATLLWKAEGLDREGLTTTVGSSSLHLAGLLKHMALVEHWWFREVLDGEPGHPVFAEVDWDADPDWEFRTAADDDPDWLRQLYVDACEASRRAVAAHDLDDRSVLTRDDGTPQTLRWILLHMIEETARHNGHADLIREAVDGSTGA